MADLRSEDSHGFQSEVETVQLFGCPQPLVGGKFSGGGVFWIRKGVCVFLEKAKAGVREPSQVDP